MDLYAAWDRRYEYTSFQHAMRCVRPVSANLTAWGWFGLADGTESVPGLHAIPADAYWLGYAKFYCRPPRGTVGWERGDVAFATSASNFRLYNKAAADVNPASDVPLDEVRIPVDSQFFLRGADMPWDFDTAISMRCVTGIGDTSTTAPGTSPKVIVFYK